MHEQDASFGMFFCKDMKVFIKNVNHVDKISCKRKNQPDSEILNDLSEAIHSCETKRPAVSHLRRGLRYPLL